MALWKIHKTYSNINRLRQIATVLMRHGFSHFLQQMRLYEHVPWLKNIVARSRPESSGAYPDLPERLFLVFQELGPAFIKLGQTLAVRLDVVPAEFQRVFARLQDKVDPMPWEAARQVLEKSLNRTAEDLFLEFDRNAVASGSIGQVHSAVMRDGVPAVVKIKRQGIEKAIRDDIDLLTALAELAEAHVPELRVLRPSMIVGEFARTMERELDFVTEAAYTAKFRELNSESGRIAVPKVFWEFATRDALVTERLRGAPFTRFSEWSGAERARAAEEAGRSFMRQYFVTGFFHADPHPGNLFLCPDGKLGILDFGQTGHLSEEMRRTLSLMLAALQRGDIDFMGDLYAEMGVFSDATDIRGFRADLRGMVDRNYGMPLDRIDFAVLAQDALGIARRHGLRLPRDFVLLAKSFVTLAGVARALDPGFRVDRIVAPFGRRMALGSLDPRSVAKGASSFAHRLASFFRRVPDDARDLLEKARAGRLTIVFHHENLASATDRVGRAADRLALGIIIAAVIIGSSIVLVAGRDMIPGRETSPLLGVPWSALLSGAGFSVSVLMALFVAWGIFRDRR